jgi:hypothetical protein
MISDKVVITEDILKAIRTVQQKGHQRTVEDLEAKEADLAEHVLEELTMIHQKLVSLLGPSKRQRHLYRQIESLLRVITLAMQSAYARLWRDVGNFGLAGSEPLSADDQSPPNDGPTGTGGNE